MCLSCNRVFDKYFGGQNPKIADYILWNMTCFPFGHGEQFERQVIELAEILRPHKRGFIRRLNACEKRQQASDRETLKKIESLKELDMF